MSWAACQHWLFRPKAVAEKGPERQPPPRPRRSRGWSRHGRHEQRQRSNDNVEGFDSLWCWAHIRRYFIRAGDAHKELRPWRDEWVGRIGALYVAHSAIKDAEPDSSDYTRALEGFDAVLAKMDTKRHQQMNDKDMHEAAHKVLRTLDREWEGLVAHRDHIELDFRQQRVGKSTANTGYRAQELQRVGGGLVGKACRQVMDDHHNSTAVGTQPLHLLHRLSRCLRREQQQATPSRSIDKVPSLGGKRRRPCNMARPAAVTTMALVHQPK